MPMCAERHITTLAAGLVLATCTVLSSTANAGPPALEPPSADATPVVRTAQSDSADDGDGEEVVLDIDAPLLEVAIAMSRLTGENFVIVDPALDGERFDIYAPEPVTAHEACKLFVSALRVRGLRVEDEGSYWAISKPEEVAP